MSVNGMNDLFDRISGGKMPTGKFSVGGTNGCLSQSTQFSNLTPYVQKHLQAVYFTLALASGAAAVGTYLDMMFHLGGLLTAIGTIGFASAISVTPRDAGWEKQRGNDRLRFGYLMGLALCSGASLGPLVQQTLWIDPSIVTTALLGTMTIFACFSISAMTSQRRSWFFLGGILSTILSTMMMLRFALFFFGGSSSAYFYDAQLYIGLAVFLGYILVDTQVIIEKAHSGHKDHIADAMSLFLDLVAIFARLLIILSKRNERRERERRN